MPADATGKSDIESWNAAVAAAVARGDHLQAIDIATRALVEHPGSLILEYQRLLAFARAGATRRAETELARLRDLGVYRLAADPGLRADFAALRGRLLKDRAMAAEEPSERASLVAQAAQAYQDAFETSGSCFPAINAATLWRVAGETTRAAAMARVALDRAASEKDAYWRRATEGEAYILLGDEPAATRALQAAASVGADRLDAVASTRRQLDWLARIGGIGGGALAALPVPKVLHWFAEPRTFASAANASPDLPLADGSRPIAFGPVLSAADVAIGGALLARGAEVNLVLPCAADVCRSFLAERAGDAIAKQFDALTSAARGVVVVTPEGDPGETTVVELALLQSRGHALLRGAALATPVESLFWADGRAPTRAAAEEPVDFQSLLSSSSWPKLGIGNPLWTRRTTRAIVFGDIHGFSTISEAQHPAFFETVVGGFADALAPLGDRVEYAETAGDGIYVVLSDVVSAVGACYALQRSVDPARHAAAGLPSGLGLRLSAHVGPVFQGLDRVTGREKFYGKEIVRTARIEPVTPMGETYVTEQFAAVLTCLAGGRYACEYVGRQAMAKGFGECRMYSLQERR